MEPQKPDVFGSPTYARNAGLEILKNLLAQQVDNLGKLKDAIPKMEAEIIELTAAVGALEECFPGPRINLDPKKQEETAACPTT